MKIAYRRLLAAWMAFFVAATMVRSWHWPLLGDAALMRYVVQSMHRGMSVYRDVHDINLPGTYFLDWLTRSAFGDGPQGLHLYEVVLFALVTAAMAFATRRTSWMYGFCGASLFWLFHLADGPAEMGQRDLVLAILLVWCMALAMELASAPLAVAMGFFGVCIGFALTIKPTGIFWVLPGLAIVSQGTNRGRFLRDARFWAGLLLPVILLFTYLNAKGSLAGFFQALFVYIPFHARAGMKPMAGLVRWLFNPSLLLLTVLLAGYLVVRQKGRDVEVRICLCGIVAGLLNYFAQMRGYNYHRYSLLRLFVWRLRWRFHGQVAANRTSGGRPRHSAFVL